jgi:hypothetical protein
VGEQKRANLRARDGIGREEYAAQRRADDAGKPVPRLLLPALQVNLRAGAFGTPSGGVRYVKIPVDRI